MGFTILDFGDFASALALDFGELGAATPGVVPASAGVAIPFAVVPSGAVLPQSRDQARRYGLDLVDPTTGNSLAGVWTDAAPPAVRAIVWGGGTGPALATPAASWADAAAAQLYLDVVPANLAALEDQPYPLAIEVMTAAGWILAWSGTLRPLDAPGTTAAPLVYCAYSDMVRLAGETLDQIRSASEGAGLLQSRAEAREWLDGVILARYRPAGFAMGGMFNPMLGVMTSVDAPNPTLAGYLAAGYLILTKMVVRIAAKKALGFALSRQLGSAELRAIGRDFDRQAENDTAALVAQIDTNGDGYPEITVNCGVVGGRCL